MIASDEVQQRITDQQRGLRAVYITSVGHVLEPWHPPMVFDARVHRENRRANLRRRARWWELEAQRGYPTSAKSAEYGQNQRWLIKLLDNGINIDRPFHVLLKEQSRRGGEASAAEKPAQGAKR